MKKTLFKLLGCCMLAVMASCGESETSDKTSTADTAVTVENAVVSVDTNATAEKSAALPPDCPACIAGQLCEDACLNAVQGCHKILPGTFTTMTTGYSGTGYDLDMAFDDLKAKVMGANCETQKIVLYGDSTKPDNTDIRLEIEPLSADEKGKTTRVSYRLPLLRSICNANPQSILFHKGKKKNGYGDIVIAVKFSATDTRYFDLSDSLPPISGKKSTKK